MRNLLIIVTLLPLFVACLATPRKSDSDENKKKFESSMNDALESAKFEFIGKDFFVSEKFDSLVDLKIGSKIKIEDLKYKRLRCSGILEHCNYNLEAVFANQKVPVELNMSSKKVEFEKSKEGSTYSVKENSSEDPKKLLSNHLTKNDPYQQFYGKFSKSYINTAKEGKIVVGMPEELLFTAWGKPNKVNRYVNSAGSTKQLVYPGRYIYIENGKISSFQSFGN